MNAEIYQIILNEAALGEFVEWLPACEPWEQFYVTLFSRKKYSDNPACQYDKTQIKRFTTTKERLFNKLRQLECPLGSYLGANDLPIPQEALAVYITINPRDLKSCFLKGISQFSDCVYRGFSESKNPRQEIMNVVQTSKSKTRYHVFDLDCKTNLLGGDVSKHSEEILNECREIVNNQCAIIETRGGYHILVKDDSIELIKEKKWYMKLKGLCDVSGDALTPIPGCIQGGFVPKLIQK